MPSLPRARDAVAIVSSWADFPWIMLVTCSEAFWRTRFQTLMTSPHVVSTIWHPRVLIASTVATFAPKAGTITTSSAPSSWISRVAGCAGEVSDAHGGELSVYFRVVDDLAEERNAAIGEDLARRIGEVDRPLDPVAESELLGQADHRSALLKHPSLAANALHETAAVVAFDLFLHA